MSEHTPGPWCYDEAETDGRAKGFVRAGERRDNGSWPAVARVCGHGKEAHANGHLIAAAPDLLAALRGMVDSASQCDDCDGSGITPGTEDSETPAACYYCGGVGEVMWAARPFLEAARAAIAKAAGR